MNKENELEAITDVEVVKAKTAASFLAIFMIVVAALFFLGLVLFFTPLAGVLFCDNNSNPPGFCNFIF